MQSWHEVEAMECSRNIQYVEGLEFHVGEIDLTVLGTLLIEAAVAQVAVTKALGEPIFWLT